MWSMVLSSLLSNIIFKQIDMHGWVEYYKHLDTMFLGLLIVEIYNLD